MKKFLAACLGKLTGRVLQKYQPRIIAVTGSVGKTTTKIAIAAVLQTKFSVRSATKNYNNELGLPLAILGLDAPGKNPFKWFAIFAEGFRLLLSQDPRFPHVLVLEFGADHPGDIAYLLKIAQPQIGVVTAVAAAHTEFFGSVEGVLAEKKLVVTRLAEGGTAILNTDDELIASLKPEIKAQIITYGCNTGEIRASRAQIHYTMSGDPDGIEVGITTDDGEVGFLVAGVLGRPVAYAAAAAVAVGRIFNLSNSEIANGLALADFPPGRMRIIPGIKNTTLIDDTYNASPRAAAEALRVLAEIQGSGRRVAVLGDMLELGAMTEDEHRKIGLLAAASDVALLVTVGAASRASGAGAREAGMSEDQIFHFDNAADAGLFLQDRIMTGDYILVKGSQGVRCEKIVKELMAQPLRAPQLLVRQSKAWL